MQADSHNIAILSTHEIYSHNLRPREAKKFRVAPLVSAERIQKARCEPAE